ncbi:DUF6114 domain-containing protein [Corynebacterium bovis]|uniref:DUF6114 domain-containing protein n=1 Tax=Corynebacterium bovis TaxID=36808 RepID=UPI003139F54C
MSADPSATPHPTDGTPADGVPTNRVTPDTGTALDATEVDGRPVPVATEATDATEAQETDGAAPTAGTTAAAPSLERTNRGFTRWRRSRPFGAGLLMILAGAVMLMPAYLSLEISNIKVQISTMSGVSTLLIGILLIVCGLMTWFRGEGRILTGVTAMILAIVALPTSNLGGFLLGTILALIGGALALSWTESERSRDRRRRADAQAAAQADAQAAAQPDAPAGQTAAQSVPAGRAADGTPAPVVRVVDVIVASVMM